MRTKTNAALFAVAFWLAFIFLAHAAPPENASTNSFRIVGYLPDYRIADIRLDAIQHVTDLVLFSAEPTADGDLNFSRVQRTDWGKLKVFKKQNNIKLILCIGGWGRSKHFSEMALSSELRRKFVAKITDNCVKESFDGIDFDWEHPKNESEQMAYADLLADCRDAFRPHGLTLSVTIAAWQGLDPRAIAAVDRIQVMAYDNEGRHSTLEKAQTDVTNLIRGGIPAKKLVLGVPFYGRKISNHNQAMTYREIFAKQGKANSDEFDDYYFNGPDTMQLKTTYALKSNLAGVMIWELGQDAQAPNSLLDVIFATVSESTK